MIKITELRVGNIVYQKTLSAVEEKTIHPLDFGTKHYDGELDFMPINLSAEWLVRLGFKIIYETTFETTENYFRIRKINNEYFWLNNDECPDIELKNIHQLQNLYFALTEKELI